MKTLLGTFALGLALVAANAGRADACSCMAPPPPTEALGRAAAVFEARVADVLPEDGGAVWNRVSLAVLRRWKGPDGGTLEVRTASSSASCGVSFETGQQYLVYADDVEGKLTVSLCSRTMPSEVAGEDVAALGEPRPGGAATVAGPPGGKDPATRPAPATLPPRSESSGCASCSGRARANANAEVALLLPFGLYALRSRPCGRRPS